MSVKLDEATLDGMVAGCKAPAAIPTAPAAPPC